MVPGYIEWGLAHHELCIYYIPKDSAVVEMQAMSPEVQGTGLVSSVVIFRGTMELGEVVPRGGPQVPADTPLKELMEPWSLALCLTSLVYDMSVFFFSDTS